ncbi:hypothetical protein M0R45_036244 [Rubus argutus]|uniref:MATH domain-containing protein n=1 Tax=Rubus argutus TaxID=59490 RepID=A0AAW1VWF0_RUBAR
MTNEEDHLLFGIFIWKIDQFSNLVAKTYYSDVFVIGGFKWRISIFPKGNNEKEHLSMYLEASDSSTLTSGLSRFAKLSLTVVNQLDRNKSITKYTKHEFTAVEKDWDFTKLMPLSNIHDPSTGYLVDDNVIVEAEVSIRKGDVKILEKETRDLIDFKVWEE